MTVQEQIHEIIYDNKLTPEQRATKLTALAIANGVTIPAPDSAMRAVWDSIISTTPKVH